MEISDLLKHLNQHNLKPDKGHLLPTASKYQTIIFDQRNELKMIIEADGEQVFFLLLPQAFFVPCEFLEKKFEGVSWDASTETLNNITTLEYQQELIKIAVELSKEGKGRAIIIK